MFARVAAEFKTLDRWVKGIPSTEVGPRFLRYHAIDMRGDMDLEIGIFGATNRERNGIVTPGFMPGGPYAVMVYRGLGLAANKALLGWIEEKGLQMDKASRGGGEAFACRYEAYLTDPKLEPRKKQWDIELAIKLKDR